MTQGHTLALTGGTGFIGNALALGLVAGGWRVRALVRSPGKASALAELGAELVVGDITDASTLPPLLEGTDVVVHCAGVVRGVTQQEFRRANGEGVANLVAAAGRHGNRPFFVSLSSLAARQPQLSAYAASKREGEDALALGAGEMPWVALRPPAVYGPGDRDLLPLFRWMMRGLGPVLGPAAARFSILYVDDLVAAVTRCLDARTRPSGIFELHDGRTGGYTWRDVMHTAAALRRKRVLPVPVPRSLLRAMAGLGVAWHKLGGGAPMLTPGKVRELTHPDWVCDNRALSQACGWVPTVQFEEGLRRTLAWHHGSHAIA